MKISTLTPVLFSLLIPVAKAECDHGLLMHTTSIANNESIGLSVGPDFRGLSPVKPAFIFYITIPAGMPKLSVEGVASIIQGNTHLPLKVAKAEYWVLSTAPRIAEPVTTIKDLASKHQNAETLYKIYFSVPTDVANEFTVRLPIVQSSIAQWQIPDLVFHRIPNSTKIKLCQAVTKE